MTIAVRERGDGVGGGTAFDKLKNIIGKFLKDKKNFFTLFFYVILQEFVMIFDDIVIQIQLNHINNLNDDSKNNFC